MGKFDNLCGNLALLSRVCRSVNSFVGVAAAAHDLYYYPEPVIVSIQQRTVELTDDASSRCFVAQHWFAAVSAALRNPAHFKGDADSQARGPGEI